MISSGVQQGVNKEKRSARRGSLFAFHEATIVFVAVFLLIIPKVNLIPFLVSGVGVKPEDILVGAVSFFYLLRLLFEGPQCEHHGVLKIRWLLSIYMIYLSLVTIVYEGQAQYLVRYTLYYSLIMLSFFRVSEKLCRRLETISLGMLCVYAALTIMQKTGAIGGIHTGIYVADASTRPSLIFTNATEAGLVSTFIFGIVLGTSRGAMWKSSAGVAAITINYLGENRSALIAVVIMIMWRMGRYLLRSSTRERKYRLIVAMPTALVAGVCAIAVYLGDVDFLRFQGRLDFTDIVSNYGELQHALSMHISPDVSVGDISRYTLGRSEGWEFDGDESLLFRLQKWSYAASVILAGNVFGIGAGNGIGDAMDGMAFRVLIESGIPGLLVYGAILLFIGRALSQGNGLLDGLWMAFVGQLSQALFLDAFYFSRPAYLFWLFFAVGTARMSVNGEIRPKGSAQVQEDLSRVGRVIERPSD